MCSWLHATLYYVKRKKHQPHRGEVARDAGCCGGCGVLPGSPPRQGGRVSSPKVKAELCHGTWVSLQGGLPRPPTVPASPCPRPQCTSPPGLLTLAFPFRVEKKDKSTSFCPADFCCFLAFVAIWEGGR